MDIRSSVTIPLALFDLVPVALAAVAVVLVARRTRWHPAFIGAALVAAGGASKAGWKLLLALDQGDHPRLADALFPLLGSGFVILAMAAWGRRSEFVVAGACVAATVGLGLPSIADGFLPVTILGATALYIALIRDARQNDDRLTIALLVASLITTYALGPLASGEQSLNAQWVEQTINTINQGAFVLAVWRLSAGYNRGEQLVGGGLGAEAPPEPPYVERSGFAGRETVNERGASRTQ